MQELQRFYRTSLRILVLVVIAVVLFAPTLIAAFGKDHIIAKVLDLLTSRFSVILPTIAGEWCIRKVLWKRLKPELDFAGEWAGTTTYDTAYLQPASTPFDRQHDVRIEQDCLSISLAPAKGESYIHWGSLAFELFDKDTVRYAYWVKYSDSAKFPDKAIGYEEMHVTGRDSRLRPTELTGEFHHCANGQGPIYSGTVKFVRKPTGRNKKVSKEKQ